MSAARRDGWDVYAAFYDWENAQTIRRRDVGFWQRIAAAADGRILELGTGTGRVAIPLAQEGIALTGLDLSAAMLDRARRRLARARLGRTLTLARGDMRALPFRRGSFGLVMAPYGVLQSLTREKDLQAALASVRRVLRPGGRFVVDLVPDLVEWSEYEGKKTLSGRMGRDTTVSLIESVRQDRRRGLTIFDQRYTTRRGRRREVHDFSLTFRTVSIPGMRQRLERHGFAVDAVLGDYKGGPIDLRADVWIILASKSHASEARERSVPAQRHASEGGGQSAGDVLRIRGSGASEARERSVPAQRHARARVGESEGRRPSDKK